MPEDGALLAVKDLEAWYGESHILHGVTFDVQAGEVVTLLGRNGVGKTTTLKAIMGIIDARTGSVRFEGRERLSSQGTKLSGGEQQMLAIGRILRTGARLLLLDEPTEGLAPVIIQQIGRTISTLKAQGFTILLVEQNFRFAATVADRYYVMENGRIVDQFSADELGANAEKLHDYLGV
jgi:branched-chain amino acid transport system ATP-binding protein